MIATAVMLTFPNGTAILRALPGDAGEETIELVRAAYGARFAREVGIVEGGPDTKLTECDYNGAGFKDMTRVRTMLDVHTGNTAGAMICDCGKGAWCPQFGVEATRQRKELGR